MSINEDIQKAERSGLYETKIQDHLTWIMPKTEHTFDENLNARKTYLRCRCGEVRIYNSSWESWALNHSTH